MTTYLCAVTTLTFALVLVYFVRKELWNRRWGDYFVRHEEREERMAAMLALVKTYYEGGRNQHREVDIVKAEVSATVEQKSQELAVKIEAVPEKVKAVLQGDGDSSVFPRTDGS